MRRHRSTTLALLLSLLAAWGFAQDRAAAPSAKADPYKDLALEQLLKIEIKSVAGLTATDLRRVPVAVTELAAREIEQSGAVDLNRFLETRVPNMQFIDHHHLQAHLGMRGVISDREDKYLFQVNGRTMNNRMLMGADNERAIPLLGDVQSVSVVRGPASATHGAGALAGVIGLQTHTGLSFQGFDVRVRQGVVDRFSAAELRFGRKTGEGAGVFAYYGIADQPGADRDDAPYYVGRSYAARNGLEPNVAGKPAPVPTLARYNAQAFGELRHKAHVSYVNGPLEVWARLVQDGHQDRPMREIWAAARPDGLSLQDWTRGRQFLNRQTTLTATFEEDLSPAFNLKLMGSYDDWWFKHQLMGTQTNAPDPKAGGEEELFARAIATWSPGRSHSLAFGGEVSRESFDNPYFSYALDRPPVVTDRQWKTTTSSLLGEYQWKVSPSLTAFASARVDKHTYSDWLFAPRASLVFTPGDADTLKLMAGRSMRRSCDEELWAEYWRSRTIPEPESLFSAELSYERKVNDSLRLAGHGFYHSYDAIGWVPALYLSTSIGNYEIGGGELVLSYEGSRTRVHFSQGIAKLIDSEVPVTLPPAGQAITAQPYGYGDDLAEWAPFTTKLSVLHDLGDRLTASTSLVYYSGFPGGQDFADYAATLPAPPSAMPLSDPGYDEPYGPNLFWNASVELRPIEKLAIRIDGYNLAELLDSTLSKRNFYFRLSEFNVQPASLGLSLRYRF